MNASGQIQTPSFGLMKLAAREIILGSHSALTALEKSSVDIHQFEDFCKMLAERGHKFQPRVTQFENITFFRINLTFPETSAISDLLLELADLGCELVKHETMTLPDFIEHHYIIATSMAPDFHIFISRRRTNERAPS